MPDGPTSGRVLKAYVLCDMDYSPDELFNFAIVLCEMCNRRAKNQEDALAFLRKW